MQTNSNSLQYSIIRNTTLFSLGNLYHFSLYILISNMDINIYKHDTFKTYIKKYTITRNSTIFFTTISYCFTQHPFISNIDIIIHKLITYKTYIQTNHIVLRNSVLFFIKTSYWLQQYLFIFIVNRDILTQKHTTSKVYTQIKYITTKVYLHSLLFILLTYKNNNKYKLKWLVIIYSPIFIHLPNPIRKIRFQYTNLQ